MSTSAAVSDATSVSMSRVTALLRHAVLAQHVVQHQFVVRLALIEAPKNEQAGHAEIAARKGLHPRRSNAHRPRGSLAARQLVAALRVENMSRRGQDAAGAKLGAAAHPGAVDHHRARTDERVVFDHNGDGVRWLQYPAEPDPTRQMHALADLRTRADRCPRVDHAAFID